jgi:hypothetical protein
VREREVAGAEVEEEVGVEAGGGEAKDRGARGAPSAAAREEWAARGSDARAAAAAAAAAAAGVAREAEEVVGVAAGEEGVGVVRFVREVNMRLRWNRFAQTPGSHR